MHFAEHFVYKMYTKCTQSVSKMLQSCCILLAKCKQNTTRLWRSHREIEIFKKKEHFIGCQNQDVSRAFLFFLVSSGREEKIPPSTKPQFRKNTIKKLIKTFLAT